MAMQNISYANYDVAKMTPFQIVTLAKDELLRRDHTDYSILVFVLKGKVRVSTSVYLKDNVENGNMFVVHEHDYICVRGVESVLLFATSTHLWRSATACLSGRQLKKFVCHNLGNSDRKPYPSIACSKCFDDGTGCYPERNGRQFVWKPFF